MVGKRNPTHIRFLQKFEKGSENACWVWQANKNNHGYGLIWSPQHGRKVLAHRYSFEFFKGEPLRIDDVVMHTCDNPSCVNPKHLKRGTMKLNSIDCASKGRSGGMKLADASVIALLKDYVAGMSHADIATKYGISVSSVPDYVTGDSRKWLHGKHGCPTTEEIRAAKNLKPGAILTGSIVLEIREKLKNGAMGKDLAEEYGIHKATVSDIKLRKIWKDI